MVRGVDYGARAGSARATRNACAGNVEATRRFRMEGGVVEMLMLARDAARAWALGERDDDVARCGMFALQTLANAGMDDEACYAAAWASEVFVDALKDVASTRGAFGAKTHGLACAFVDASVRNDGALAERVIKEAQTFWLSILRASTERDEPDGVGGGTHLVSLVRTVCCLGDGLPRLFRGLSPNGAEVAARKEEILRAHLVALAVDDSAKVETAIDQNAMRLEYVSEQATLLHFIASIMADKEATSYVDIHHEDIPDGEQPPLLMPQEVLAFLLDTTSIVAGRFAAAVDEDERRISLSLLMECVSVLRSVSEREVKPHLGDTVACLAAMGLVRLVLSLLAALPPPEGIGQTSKATGPAAAPKLQATINEELKSDVVYPSNIPWVGYRVDLIAIVGNACFNRPHVCDDVAKLGGVSIVLNHTRGEDGEAYLREWALWAVRNMTQVSDLARKKILELHPQAVEESEELLAKGLGVELNRETGRPRIVKQDDIDDAIPSGAGSQLLGDKEVEPTIPANWKVTEL